MVIGMLVDVVVMLRLFVMVISEGVRIFGVMIKTAASCPTRGILTVVNSLDTAY